MTNVTSLVEGQAPEEAEFVVICRIAVVIFLQPDDGFVVLHVVAQPLSHQIWVNRAFCGKSTKFGTHVHDTNKK